MACASSSVGSRELVPIQILVILSCRGGRATRYAPIRICPICTAWHRFIGSYANPLAITDRNNLRTMEGEEGACHPRQASGLPAKLGVARSRRGPGVQPFTPDLAGPLGMMPGWPT